MLIEIRRIFVAMEFQIKALTALRDAIIHYKTDENWQAIIYKAQIQNQWFEKKQIEKSIESWINALELNNIKLWLSNYKLTNEIHNKRLGIIMAGNIPFVGMHDVIVGVISGFKIIAKCSSEDEVLPKFWISEAAKLNSIWSEQVEYSDQFKNVDAAIATGSNNSSRYFEYYFRNIPHILRKNRNSIAVLTGNETTEELVALGNDVFDYFGLGCRNVTKIYFPENYSFKTLFDVWEKSHAEVAFHNKYVNNYNYHKALLLMNLDPHIDAGFVLMKERKELYSPVGMVNYEFYSDVDNLKLKFEEIADEIQCVVSQNEKISTLKLGQSQCPTLWDYADGIDTVQWALNASQ